MTNRLNLMASINIKAVGNGMSTDSSQKNKQPSSVVRRRYHVVHYLHTTTVTGFFVWNAISLTHTRT